MAMVNCPQDLEEAAGQFAEIATQEGSSQTVARLVGGHDCAPWTWQFFFSGSTPVSVSKLVRYQGPHDIDIFRTLHLTVNM